MSLVNSRGESALHVAARRGLAWAVPLLLRAGARLELRSRYYAVEAAASRVRGRGGVPFIHAMLCDFIKVPFQPRRLLRPVGVPRASMAHSTGCTGKPRAMSSCMCSVSH